MNNADKGKIGEIRAKSLLEEKGHTILSTNFRSRRGEIDIISFLEGKVFFWEIKAWNQKIDYHPLEIFHETKKRKMRKEAERYLNIHPAFNHLTLSFGLAHSIPNQEVVFYSDLF